MDHAFSKNTAIILSIASVLLMNSPAISQIPCLSGFVYDESSSPVQDADLDFDDAITGERIYTPGDNTDPTGFFRVCVIPGLYNVTFAPPPRTHLLGRQFYDISLSGPGIDMGIVTLRAGVAISGNIQDSLGFPVPEVDIDMDTLAGGRVFTPDDNSDSTGAYWVVVPSGQFRMRLSPPRGSRFLGQELDSLFIAGDTTIDITLAEGALFSGLVRNSAGDAIEGIQIDLRDHWSGQKIFLPNNETDSTGYYVVAAPQGLFDLRFAPVFGSRYVALQFDSVQISSDMTWDQQLEEGVLVSVVVTDTSEVPVAGADLDFTLESDGSRVFTPYDKTDDNGTTIAALLPDSYTVRIDPPPGTLLDRLTVTGIQISSDTSLIFTLREIERVHFSGRVTNHEGDGLVDVAIGLAYPSDGGFVTLHNNLTDTSGVFDFRAPLGNFDLYFGPPNGSHYLGRVIENVTFVQDTVWNDVVLDSGLLITAQVFDSRGMPMADANLDFFSASSGLEIFTPHDTTNGMGISMVAIPSGSYNINVEPPPQSLSRPLLLEEVQIYSDTSVVLVMTDNSGSKPIDFKLWQNSPNPFNGHTTISFTLLKPSPVSIEVFNVLGQRIIAFDRGFQNPGYYSMIWDGRDSEGNLLSSGLFFYRILTDYGTDSKKMTFIK
jgi:hypothetical protein